MRAQSISYEARSLWHWLRLLRVLLARVSLPPLLLHSDPPPRNRSTDPAPDRLRLLAPLAHLLVGKRNEIERGQPRDTTRTN